MTRDPATPQPAVPPSVRRVVIAHRLAGSIAELIGAARPALEFRPRRVHEVTLDDLQWADTLVGFRRPPGFGKLRWIHSIGAGVDGFTDVADPPGSSARSSRPVQPAILLTRTSERYGPIIGEYVAARVLAACQHLPRFLEAQRERRWAPETPRPARGTRALVVGMGEVGSGVSGALEAIGVGVTGVSRSGRGAEPVSRLPDLVAGADWIVLALPLTRESRGLVGEAVLGRCRGAWLINVARGGVVDEAALLAALDAGRLGGAALDVFEQEPLPADSPLWGHPGVLLSPHVAGVTTAEGAAAGFLECLEALERGEVPRWKVDWERGY